MLANLSDEELVSRLETIRNEDRRLLARLLVHLAEVEDRRLHLKTACPSLFEFCVRRLGMSEGAAFRRINGARLVRRFPCLLGTIERGDIHLSTLVLLRDHLSEANVDELVAAASGKSKRQVQELLARRAPRADVPATIRKLPGTAASPGSPGRTGSPGPADATGSAAANSTSLRPARGVVSAARTARIEPLSEARYKLQLTGTVAFRDKLERARDLMRHRNPSGDLAVVVERALDLLLDKLETERLGKSKRAGREAPAPRRSATGRVPRQVRREVFARDGEQCTFVDETGRRCPAQTLLELDHVVSRALGGSDATANLRVYCRLHNALHAEEVFGREHVAKRVRLRQQESARAPPVQAP